MAGAREVLVRGPPHRTMFFFANIPISTTARSATAAGPPTIAVSCPEAAPACRPQQPPRTLSMERTVRVSMLSCWRWVAVVVVGGASGGETVRGLRDTADGGASGAGVLWFEGGPGRG